ncbi:MAG TPA: phosphopantothenoylcysteine decarboxylase, partial [Candidatus Baltobacteraceae bacterium]|nr:phosphopantothenoylcysteine decarboxylase [Candidatus Baltobacteraceae bacterium]
MKKSYVIAGGTFVQVAPHFALSAPAFGKVGRDLAALLPAAYTEAGQEAETRLVLTRMALGGAERPQADQALLLGAGIEDLETNEELEKLVDHLIARPDTGAIVMAAAACDFRPAETSEARFSSATPPALTLVAEEKIIRKIRRLRKDIFLVGFKTTSGAAADDQYMAGLRLLKSASCNLVLANDLRTRLNMVITPEQARYHETTDRAEALRGLASMLALRSKLKFTRATVVPGEPVPWTSPLVPASLRAVVDYCIERGAYKPFLNATVGHFAVKVDARTILTSRRKTDFNKLGEIGLVKVEADGEDSVVAYGSKPSVGGQSQRIIFKEHPDVDCIVHFHCPKKPESQVPMRSQR